jgi:hypothetical protein
MSGPEEKVGTDEKIGVDLFVNGRLRERDILKHIPTDRLAVSYLYGQIHFNDLDDKEKDRFTSSREGIVADDPKYQKFLEDLRKKLSEILEDWDKWRLEKNEEGDSENDRISQKERSSVGLFNAVSQEYVTDNPDDPDKKKIDGWIEDFSDDAKYNFTSYAECFISENLIRRHVLEKSIPLTTEAVTEVDKRKKNEIQFKNKANISIEIRQVQNDLNYLSMDFLAYLVDKPQDLQKEACLSRDANEYKPIRDALMHTSLLTKEAKQKLNTTYGNIKARVKTLLKEKEESTQ